MKEDEKLFFVLCFQLRMKYGIDVRNIISMLQPFINKKRLWYLLEKWFRQGFYDYGIRLDLGWFEIEKMPNRYSDLVFIYCPYRYNNPLCKCKKTTNLLMIIGLALGVKKIGLKVRQKNDNKQN